MNTLLAISAPSSLAQSFISEVGPISPSLLQLGTGDCSTLTIDELEAAVVADPVLSLRALALANSAFYSQQHEIAELRSALIVLGADAVHNLAASLLARSVHSSSPNIDEALWQHSQAVAVAGQIIAEAHQQVAAKQAFAAGLLHDIGILALQRSSDTDDERQTDHAALGAEIAELLGLSPSLSNAIRHHDRSTHFDFNGAPLEATVCVANHLAVRCGYGYDGESTDDEDLIDDLVSGLGLKRTDIDSLADSLATRLENLHGMFNNENGGPS